MTLPEPKITEELVKKYDRAGPRYTSYPTAPIWSKEFGDNEWDAVLDVANGESNRSLALYALCDPGNLFAIFKQGNFELAGDQSVAIEKS